MFIDLGKPVQPRGVDDFASVSLAALHPRVFRQIFSRIKIECCVCPVATAVQLSPSVDAVHNDKMGCFACVAC